MYKHIKHVNDGKFEVILDDGTTKEAGSNICGIIRYTYFEDYTFPPEGWSVSREKLLNDYQEKVIPDIISGKITPNTMNY